MFIACNVNPILIGIATVDHQVGTWRITSLPAYQFRIFTAMLVRYMLSSCVPLSVHPSVRPCVCPSVCHKPVKYQNDWTDRVDFWYRCFLSPTCILCYKEVRVSPKLRLLPSGTLFQTLDFRKFRHGKSTVLPTKLVNDRTCSPHLRWSLRHGWTVDVIRIPRT